MTADRPLVSIVLCCHNRRHYLEQTMASVFAQRYTPVEIIVMDDGSTDGTDALMAQYGDRIRYLRQPCQGIAAARTNASRVARGEYIAYQDDDDLMPPDRIVHLYEALLAYPTAVLATGDYALIDADGNLTGNRWMPGPLDEVGAPTLIEDGQAAVLWPRVPAVPHTTLFRRELGERINWFDLDFKYACSDADFLARLGQLGPVVYLREVVSHYRRGHNAIWNDDLRSSCSQIQLWTKHLKLIGDGRPELSARLKERMRSTLVRIAGHRPDPQAAVQLPAEHYLRVGMGELSLPDRLWVRFQTSVKQPLRQLVKGVIKAEHGTRP